MRITPTSGTAPAQTPQVLGEEFFNDDFFADVDKAFAQIQMAPKKTKKKTVKRRKARAERELRQMQTTYLAVTQVHLRPVLRYLKAIQVGVASKDLCELVHYVIGPLVGKTRKVGLVDQTKTLIAFQRQLKAAARSASRKLTNEQRDALTKSFNEVQKSFVLEFRGHSTAVVNLLGFYRTVRRSNKFADQDRKRLFGIGIPSLSMLRKTSLAELSSLSGLKVEKVQELRKAARKFNILSLV